MIKKINENRLLQIENLISSLQRYGWSV